MTRILGVALLVIGCASNDGTAYLSRELRAGFPLFSLDREPGCLTAWVERAEPCRVAGATGAPALCVSAIDPIVLVPDDLPSGQFCAVSIERGCGHCAAPSVEAVNQYGN